MKKLSGLVLILISIITYSCNNKDIKTTFPNKEEENIFYDKEYKNIFDSFINKSIEIDYPENNKFLLVYFYKTNENKDIMQLVSTNEPFECENYLGMFLYRNKIIFIYDKNKTINIKRFFKFESKKDICYKYFNENATYDSPLKASYRIEGNKMILDLP